MYRFGWSVDASSNGDLLAAGAFFGDYVNFYTAEDSSLQKYSQLAGRARGSPYSWLGWALSISSDGNRLAVGAPKNIESDENRGRVFFYDVY